jgi:RNA methyltransferase, TrmH family
MNDPQYIESRDNPLLKRLRMLAQDNTAYRKIGQVWLEGDHLCRALLAPGRASAARGIHRDGLGACDA